MTTTTETVTVTCPDCEQPRQVAPDTAKTIRYGRRSAHCRNCSPSGRNRQAPTYPGPAAGLPRNWSDNAACRDHDPELWYPLGQPGGDKYERVAEIARTICRTECPVIAECLEDALQAGDRWGIRGGLDPEQRGEQFGDRRRKAAT